MFKLFFLSVVILSGTIGSIYSLSVPDVNNGSIHFNDYRGKMILIVNTATASPTLEPLLTLPDRIELGAPTATHRPMTDATVWNYALTSDVQFRLAESIHSVGVPVFRAKVFRSAKWIDPVDAESEMRLFSFSGSIDPNASVFFRLRGDLRLSAGYAPASFSHINIDVQQNVADCFDLEDR